MPPKKSVEELDAELAALEAELAALEAGEAPPKPKKAKKPKKAAPPPAPPAAPAEAPPEEAPAAPASRLPLRLPRRAAPAEGAPAKKRFALPFGKKAAPEPPAEEAPAGPAAEAAEDLPPEPEPEPELEPEPARPADVPARDAPAHAWEGRSGAWRARPAGPQKVEVVRRELDAQGRVVAEQDLGEEYEAGPEPEPAPAPEEPPARRFGFFGAPKEPAGEAAPGAEGETPREGKKKRGWILIPILLIAAILLLALVLPALGVDPLGLGSRTGVGGGAAPTATFAVSGTVAAVGTPVTFDASGTTGATEYNWDFGDGAGAQGAQVSHTYGTRGEYDVVLTARGAGGKTATHTVTVTIAAPPTARIAATLDGNPLSAENSPAAGDEITFNGGGSTADGGIATYDWQFGDGARATGAEASHAYAAAGSYRATLQVVDRNGLRGNATFDVFVGLRTAVAGELPASVQGPVAVNQTVAVTTGGGALPYAPASLRATLMWNASSSGLPVPGLPALPADNLLLVIYDADGVEVARSAGGVSPQEVEVTAFAGALGDWSIEVSRPQGGPSAIAYQLDIVLRNGPA